MLLEQDIYITLTYSVFVTLILYVSVVSLWLVFNKEKFNGW